MWKYLKFDREKNVYLIECLSKNFSLTTNKDLKKKLVKNGILKTFFIILALYSRIDKFIIYKLINFVGPNLGWFKI